jgi:hypothetical protein
MAATAVHKDFEIGRGDPGNGAYLLIVRPHQFQLHRQASVTAVPSQVRLVENFGPEHVYHVEYGNDLVAVIGAPGFCREGEDIYLGLDNENLMLIDPATDDVIALEPRRAAA